MKKFLALLLSCILLLGVQTVAFAEVDDEPEPIEPEEKLYSDATLEDDFADDSVIVMLFNEQSLKLLTYTPDDFPVDNISEVRDLTSYSVEAIKEQRENGTNEINEKKFNQILKLTLTTKSKQAVLDTIKELEKVDFIMCAEPNYYSYPAGGGWDGLGDPDLDQFVKMTDVVLLQRHIAKLADLTDEQIQRGDVDKDNLITMSDVTLIQKNIACLHSF